ALFAEPGVAPPRDLERTLKALRFSNVESRLAVDVAQAVAALGPLATLEGDDVALRRWVADAGRLVVPAALRVVLARALAEGGGNAVEAEAWQRDCVARFRRLHRRAMAIAWRDPITIGDLAVDGDDLRTVGITDGRAIGETLRALLEAVLEDPARNTVDGLLARARRAP
ncbi:MAG: hypothetical protein P3A32_08090, partial [Gemmatimonadota bacterium]|nr:hypothetical protein [Gemmatimonadota bacterium]MDQ8149763.1 hypothetical protein [Gemmatimonadota bacterium]